MKRLLLVILILALLPVGFLIGYYTKQRFSAPTTEPGSAAGLEGLSFQLDIPYAGTDNPRQRLNLYVPNNRKLGKLPAIVYVHGGGWEMGDRSDGAGLLIPLVSTGKYVGVSSGYRLSGEATWPAQIHDCKAAIRWVRANADRYFIDPNKIGVWGRSAGGHLVLMLGMSGDVPELEGNLGQHNDVSSKVACVVNFFGVTDLLGLIGQPSDLDRTKPDVSEARLIGGPLRENADKARAASPITYVHRHAPPVLTVHGDADRTVPYDQAVRLDKALCAVGVKRYFVTVKGGGHLNFGNAANGRVVAFFEKYLHDIGDVSTSPIEIPRR
jgi:acetyl esterase/lipase